MMHGKVYIKLLKQQKTGDYKNSRMYFDKGIKQFKNHKK